MDLRKILAVKTLRKTHRIPIWIRLVFAQVFTFHAFTNLNHVQLPNLGLTFRVPLHHAAIPETEIQTACEQFNYWVNNHTHILKFENMAIQRFVEFCFESIKLDEYITGAT